MNIPGQAATAVDLRRVVEAAVQPAVANFGRVGFAERGGIGANTLRSVRTGPSTVTFGRACCTDTLSQATRSWWRQSCS